MPGIRIRYPAKNQYPSIPNIIIYQRCQIVIVVFKPALGGFVNSQQINRINAFFGKLVDLGFVAPHVFVTYQNIPEWLTVDYLIVYKALPIVSHILPPEKQHFGLRSRGYCYALLICPDNLCKCLLIPDVYFVFFNNCVSIVVSAIVLGLHDICVCHLLSNTHNFISPQMW